MKPPTITVLIRGGGEMATGIAHRLHQCHLRVVIAEIAAPTSVRRSVAFAEAVFEGSQTVEGVRAVRVAGWEECQQTWRDGSIPVLVDASARLREQIRPHVLVDAIMAKKGSTTRIDDAPLVIGVGPGFTVGDNAHAVVETNRGYNLGRVYWRGSAEADTGVPAPVDGFTETRVLRAPGGGALRAHKRLGEAVQPGEVVAEVGGIPVRAEISGIVRGMLRDGVCIDAGVKIGDIDPRGEREYCNSISDKARAIGGGVLEAILHAAPKFANYINS